jgi:chaperonin GroES
MQKELMPVNQNIIVDFGDKKEEKTTGGIIIPDTAKEKPKFARVVAISNIENCEIAVGDTVFFKDYSGTEIEFEGKKLLVLPYADVMAKVVETEEI